MNRWKASQHPQIDGSQWLPLFRLSSGVAAGSCGRELSRSLSPVKSVLRGNLARRDLTRWPESWHGPTPLLTDSVKNKKCDFSSSAMTFRLSSRPSKCLQSHKQSPFLSHLLCFFPLFLRWAEHFQNFQREGPPQEIKFCWTCSMNCAYLQDRRAVRYSNFVVVHSRLEAI